MNAPVNPPGMRPSFFRTTAFRWVVRSSAAFLVSSALLFGFIYWQTAGRLNMQFDPGLREAAAGLAQMPTGDLPRALGGRIADDPLAMKLAGLFGPDGRPIAGNVPHRPRFLPGEGQFRTMRIERVLSNGTAERSLARVLVLHRGTLTLLLGHDLTEVVELRDLILRALALGVLPALILGLAAGAVVSTTTVRRIELISEAARRITAGRLDERLPHCNSGDDLDQIAGVVNAMLGDIERLMMEVKTSGDAIAHDLRTPLTRLRNKLEQASGRGPEAAERALDGAIAEIDQVVAILEALLRIGEIERGRRRAGFAPFDLACVGNEAAELFAPIAEEKGLDFMSVIAPATMVGDRDLMFELFSNLLDNAVKYTPPGGCVTLRVLGGETGGGPGGGVVIEVQDDGPGIAAQEREAVLRRFYRCDRSRQKRGGGLGLSLVTAIAQLHGMRLWLESGCGGRGLRARVTLVHATGVDATRVDATLMEPAA